MRNANKLVIRVPRVVEARAEGALAVTLLSAVAIVLVAIVGLLGR